MRKDSPNYSGDSTMRNIVLATAFLALCCMFASSLRAAQPALVSADWSVNAAHNLASNPPSLDAVQDFYDRAFGAEEPFVKVCEFRFADLRSSGNLSLIITANPGGRQWPECNELDIFDKTPTGFELYDTDGAYGHDLASSVLDINHDGRHELVLWGDLSIATGFSFGQLGCGAEWPLIFAWTGNGYSEVGDQYKDYYQNYLKSVEARLAAYSSELGAASAQTANPVPVGGSARIGAQAETSTSLGVGGPAVVMGPVLIAPAPTPEAAPTPKAAPIPGWAARNLAQQNYPCARIEAAKTEAFLGIDSASTMSAAIKDSESDEPNKRILAAVIFSYLGTPEAGQDLKTLGNDADSRVAAVAKKAASLGEDPIQRYRIMIPGGASWGGASVRW